MEKELPFQLLHRVHQGLQSQKQWAESSQLMRVAFIELYDVPSQQADEALASELLQDFFVRLVPAALCLVLPFLHLRWQIGVKNEKWYHA